LKSVNTDFEWNLFFRILFEIELGNNAEDFEKFIGFIKNRYYNNKNLLKLKENFTENQAKEIADELIIGIAKTFEIVDSVKYIYDNNVEKINVILNNSIEIVCKDIKDFNIWKETKKNYLRFMQLKVIDEFECNKNHIIYKELYEEIKKYVYYEKDYSAILNMLKEIIN
jgi:hypothetical protein